MSTLKPIIFETLPDPDEYWETAEALKETVPQVENNIFRATENVVLNKVLGYKIHGEKHSFLEDY